MSDKVGDALTQRQIRAILGGVIGGLATGTSTSLGDIRNAVRSWADAPEAEEAWRQLTQMRVMMRKQGLLE